MHVMTPKSRQYYDLDSFWGNGTPVPLEGVLTPNAPPSEEPVAEEVVSFKGYVTLFITVFFFFFSISRRSDGP